MNSSTRSAAGRRLLCRRKLLVLAALGAALVAAVPLAWASHQFTDVSNAHPFHDQIGAIAGAGITGGKNCVPPGTPPTYCPDEPVVRQAMAAFLSRGLGRVAYGDGGGAQQTLPVFPSEIDIAVLIVDVPGIPGQTQFVKLDAAVTSFTQSTTGCPCSNVFRISRDGGPAQIGLQHHTQNDLLAPSGLDQAGFDSAGLTAVDVVPSGTTQTYRLRGGRVASSVAVVKAFGDLSAITAPFGSSGGSTLEN